MAGLQEFVDQADPTARGGFKEGRALRTELTVNTPRDFGFGKALFAGLVAAHATSREKSSNNHSASSRRRKTPARLRQVAFAANRRLWHVQQLSHDPTLGDDEFRTLTTPQVIDGQRVSGLRFGDTTVLAVLTALMLAVLTALMLAVLTALMMFLDPPQGFTNSQLRHTTARLLTRSAQDLKPGLMTYHLRRLRRRGLITRVPRTHRYEVTDDGHRAALFYTTSLARVIRPTATDLDSPNRLAKLAKALAPTKT